MALYGALDASKHLSEFGDPLLGTAEGALSPATRRERALQNLTGDSNIVLADITKLAAVTASAAELNILDGVTASAAELNILDGVTATAAELNTVDTTAGTAAASKATVLDANAELNSIGVLKSADKLVSSAEVLALNATPITLVAAPGAGVYLEFVRAYLFLDFNAAAYADIAAGEDLSIKYTDASGAAASADIETTGFLDATADALAIAEPAGVVAVANAALVLHLLVDEITTGDSPLKVRTLYREVRTAGLEAIA